MRDTSLCVHRPPSSSEGFASLSVPVARASTIVFPDAESYIRRSERGPDGYTYGLNGTTTTKALEAQISALEAGERTTLVPSGQAAITVVMLAVLSPGDHVLIPDSVYPPVRDFAERVLTRLGMEPEFYAPLIGGDIATLIRDTTRLVWVESPGSTTMEIQDLSAIVMAAHLKGALVGCDNTWASPLLFKPLVGGADLSIEALTKYMGGHSDLLMGSIAVRDLALHSRIKDTTRTLGIGVSPDDCSLVLRGIETLAVRMRSIGAAALDLAAWLATRPEVACVLHPALPSCPGHEIWRRDFSGASGVFSVLLRRELDQLLKDTLGRLHFFAFGASWGGTRSLIVPMDVRNDRSVVPWTAAGTLLRISVGLEDPADLREDLEVLMKGLG